MQLGVGGTCGDYWGRNKCDGNDDGRLLVTDFWDNVCAGAARGLRRDKGAPPAGGSEAGLPPGRLQLLRRLRRRRRPTTPTRSWPAPSSTASSAAPPPTPPACLSCDQRAGAGCSGAPIAAGDGEFIVDPGANRPGADLAPELVGFVRRMAVFLPRPPIVTTGTNHSPTTTSGNPSDHWTGHAADFGSVRNGFPATGGGYGDKIAAPRSSPPANRWRPPRQSARRGGPSRSIRGGLRIQIIWKTLHRRNHYDHVHVGIRREDPLSS